MKSPGFEATAQSGLAGQENARDGMRLIRIRPPIGIRYACPRLINHCLEMTLLLRHIARELLKITAWVDGP